MRLVLSEFHSQFHMIFSRNNEIHDSELKEQIAEIF